eukprot:tig00000944_g5934.t1
MVRSSELRNIALRFFSGVDAGRRMKPDFVDWFLPIWKQLDTIAELQVDYILQRDESAPLGFASKHGETEVLGDVVELCAQSVMEPAVFYQFLRCLDANLAAIPSNADACAGDLVEKLGECTMGPRGRELLAASAARASRAGATWSPTIALNGAFYCKFHDTCFEGRAPDLVAKICELYGPAPDLPDACDQVGR